MARARNELLLFLSRRFRRWRRFFHWLFKSHRFHGFTQIFFIDYLSPTDFTELHRFFSLIIFLMDLHGFSLIFFFFSVISQILDLSVWNRFRRFIFVDYFSPNFMKNFFCFLLSPFCVLSLRLRCFLALFSFLFCFLISFFYVWIFILLHSLFYSYTCKWV